VGFVRGFGKYLPREQITMNAVCPCVVRTGMTNAFSDKLEGLGLLTPMSSVVEAFLSMLGSNDVSGECFEAGPKGYKIKSPSDYSDEEIMRTMMMISEKSLSLHEPVKE
jgi:NAD(P)-dependent dehydrogenase (short-subunit alcohol dehydrogenase family)